MRRHPPPAAGLAVVLAVVALLLAAVGPAAAHANNVEADAQISTDGTLVVEWEFSEVDGWLAVREDDGGEPGEPVGARRVDSESAFQTDTTIRIDEGEWASTTGGRDLWVTLHREEGGDGFDPDDDPVVTFFENVAGSRLTVAPGERPARVSAEGFGSQAVTDDTVTVRRVELPEDGFVALHESSADVPQDADGSHLGDVVGVTELEAGVHENVTVDLAASFVAGGARDEVVQAVVYRGDGSLDAAATERVRAGEAPVETAFRLEFAGHASTPVETADGSPVVITPEATATPATPDGGADADGAGVGPLGAVGAVAAAIAALEVVARGRGR